MAETSAARAAHHRAVAAEIREKTENILPEIAARAGETEALRRVPDANIAALRQAGWFTAFLPARYGGQELDILSFYELLPMIGQVCPSTAWATMLLGIHTQGAAMFSEKAQDELWADAPDTLLSSSLAPVGKVTPVEGGLRISGRYRFSTGCDHARWAIIGSAHADPATGKIEARMNLVPATDYAIDDASWHVTGMSGSGSKDLVLEDVFVPEHRSELTQALNSYAARGHQVNRDPLYRCAFGPFFAYGLSAASIGIAEGVIAAYTAHQGKRISAFTGGTVAESTPAYMRLAEAAQEVDCAKLMLRRDMSDLMAAAETEHVLDYAATTRMRCNATYVTELCTRAVDRLFRASGGMALQRDNHLQRAFRDMHGAAAHAFSDYDVARQIYGRLLLGLPPAGNLA